jgi:hypothetical protein
MNDLEGAAARVAARDGRRIVLYVVSTPAGAAAALWRVSDTFILNVCAAVGFGLIVVSWWGTSGTALFKEQVMWLNVGGAGLIVLGIGNCSWLLSGRRALGARRRNLLDGFADVREPTPMATGASDGADPLDRVDAPVWGTGMRHYHRPDCQLVFGKRVEEASRNAHARAGRVPCGMCQP